MSTYYGACDNCGAKSSLEPVRLDIGEVEKLCHTCYTDWLNKQVPAESDLAKRDYDDERKYGRYDNFYEED